MNQQSFLSNASESLAWKRRAWRCAIGLTLSMGLAACGAVDSGGAFEEGAEGGDDVAATATESAPLINNGGLGVTGGGCTVTDGIYTGKSGKYDEDGWCCFSNVCVDCAGNRCKDKKLSATIVKPAVIGNAANLSFSR